MEKGIKIQVHDYDLCGNYRIVEERTATKREVIELKKKARDSVKLDWTAIPKDFTHVVYYGELLDENGNVWYAGIYMRGECFQDGDFHRIFNSEDVGYVGAYHRR